MVPSVIALDDHPLPLPGGLPCCGVPCARGWGGSTRSGSGFSIEFHLSKSQHSVPFGPINGNIGIKGSKKRDIQCRK